MYGGRRRREIWNDAGTGWQIALMCSIVVGMAIVVYSLIWMW